MRTCIRGVLASDQGSIGRASIDWAECVVLTEEWDFLMPGAPVTARRASSLRS